MTHDEIEARIRTALGGGWYHYSTDAEYRVGDSAPRISVKIGAPRGLGEWTFVGEAHTVEDALERAIEVALGRTLAVIVGIFMILAVVGCVDVVTW